MDIENINKIKTEKDARQALVERIVNITRALGEEDLREVTKQAQFYMFIKQHAIGRFGIDTSPYDNITKTLVPNLG